MAEKKPTKVENAKAASGQLRGTIAEVLADGGAEKFEHDDIQCMKFHGIYQQDNRDERAGKEKHYSFMIRTKCPGGRMTAEQYLAQDAIATRYSFNDSLRLTTRQAVQFHGVIKGKLKATMQALNKALVSTIAACGDVERNVMCSPAPLADPAHRQMRALTDEIAEKLAPATGAYYEIWLDGEKVDRGEHVVEEPFYGETYLPRKFKTGVATPEDNSVDVYTQDCGLVTVHDGEQITAVNVLVGGGLGMTHRKADTFARMGTPLGSVAPEHAADAVKAVVSIHRDFGDRTDRRHARLKYVVEDHGIDWFRQQFKKRVDFPLNDWIEVGPMQLNDYLGKHAQGDGKFFYGMCVQNGRVSDFEGGPRIKSAFREIVETLRPSVVLTPNQSLLFADLEEGDIDRLEAILAKHGVAKPIEVKGTKRYSMACVALPTCGLALAEAERYLPDLVDEISGELARHGLDDEPITIRMTGCPNGCGRPYTADLAFVGRKQGVYDIFFGGRLAGDRMAELYAESVPDDEILGRLRPVFDAWAKDRQGDEALGDFYNRVFAAGEPRTMVTGSKESPSELRVLEACGSAG